MCHAEYYKQNWAKEVSRPRTFGTFCMSSHDTMISGRKDYVNEKYQWHNRELNTRALIYVCMYVRMYVRTYLCMHISTYECYTVVLVPGDPLSSYMETWRMCVCACVRA
jgi:hypothetical protein